MHVSRSATGWRPRTTIALAFVLTVVLVGADPGRASGATDEAATPDSVLVLVPAVVTLEPAGSRRVRAFRCPLAGDAASARTGADRQAGTDDDACRPARRASLVVTEAGVATIEAAGAARWTVRGDSPGEVTLSAEQPGSRAGAGVVVVLEALPPGDPAAIGTRARGTGDVDRDGRLTAADRDRLAADLEGAVGGFLRRGDAALPSEGDLDGDGHVSAADLAELERQLRLARRRDRIQREGDVLLTPRDIAPLHAGGTVVVGAMVGGSGARQRRVAGTLDVRLMGPGRLYYQGVGQWGAAGEVPATLLWDAHGVAVFAVPDEGVGFIAHAAARERVPQSTSFQALPPGERLPLPGPGQLTTPYDVNDDGVLDLADLAIAVSALGTRAGDRGFPAASDANADGILTVDDIGPLANVVALAGVDPLDARAGSGDVDGDGDVDAADLRAAIVLERLDLRLPDSVAERLAGDALADIEASYAAIAQPASLDLDGDGTFDRADVTRLADELGLDPGSLGPYYDAVGVVAPPAPGG